MKKTAIFLVTLHLAFGIVARAGAALSVTDIVTSLDSGENTTKLSFGCINTSELLRDEHGFLSLLAHRTLLPALKTSAGTGFIAEVLDHSGEAIIWSEWDDMKKPPKQAAFAIEITDLNVAPPHKSDAPFLLQNIPAGTELIPVRGFPLSGSSTMHCAWLARGKQRFLIGVKDDPLSLARMAAAVEKKRDVPPERAKIWFSFFEPVTQKNEKLQKYLRDNPWMRRYSGDYEKMTSMPEWRSNLSQPFVIYLTDTASSVRFLIGQTIDAPLSDDKPPIVLGDGRLLGVCSLGTGERDPMVPTMEFQKDIQKFFDLTDEETASMTRSRCTLSIVGQTKTMIGSVPGLCLVYDGIMPSAAEKLTRLAVGFAQSKLNFTFQPFEYGGWKGIRSAPWSMFSCFAAQQGDRFVLAVQDVEELGRKPKIEPRIQHDLDSRSLVILDFDIIAIADTLLELSSRLSLLFQDETQKKSFLEAVENFRYLEVVRFFLTPDAFGEWHFDRSRIEKALNSVH